MCCQASSTFDYCFEFINNHKNNKCVVNIPLVNTQSTLTGYYQNCRGLRTKLSTLKCNIASNNFVFIILTETWLNPDIYDPELGFDSYIIYRCDRNSLTSSCSRGGGVLIAIHIDFLSKLIPISCNNIEHLFISFSINNEPFIVGVVYFHPSSLDISYANYTSTVEDLVNSFVNANFILCGDFNLPNIYWSNDNQGLVYSKISRPGPYVQCVPETFAFLNFFLVNNVFNIHGTLLDLIFVNSNHIKINTFSDPKSDYLCIKEFLSSFDWRETFINLDANLAMSTFHDALHFSVLKWVPHVNYTKSNFPSWLSKDLIDLVFLKRRAHAIFKSSRNPLDYREFSLLRAKYKLMSKNCYKKFIELTESQLCANPKLFWKLIKKNKSSNDIP